MSSGNFLFLSVLILGPLVSISSSNWMICWVGLELSFLGAIPLLLSDSSFMSLSKESVMKYFCIQALGSGLLMLGGMILYSDMELLLFAQMIFIFSLFIKLGVFPMHFWVPSVAVGLNWMPMFILLTWQKIPPFAFLINIIENTYWLKMLILIFGGLSALVGSIIGLNQTSVRAMLGSSSIVHTGWSCIGSVSGGLWLYFSIYSISFIILTYLFILKEDFMIGFGILSLSGLPPFLMFAGKWMVLKSFMMSSWGFIFLILPIVGALFSLFFYLKFFYSFYLSSSSKSESGKLFLFTSFMLVTLSGVLFMLLICFGDRG